jgi:hypothetical protein
MWSRGLGRSSRVLQHPRLRADPHLRPAPLVRGEPQRAGQLEARLVRLARPEAGRISAEQLAERVWRVRLVARPGDGAVLRPRLPAGAARPELAQQ